MSQLSALPDRGGYQSANSSKDEMDNFVSETVHFLNDFYTGL